MQRVRLKYFFRFVSKFILLFCIFYFGTKLIIGLSAPGGFYAEFVSDYLDYVSQLKYSLMKGASVIANIFGYKTIYEPNFLVRVVNARGVIIAYDCVGYGVMSFWAAFVLSSESKVKKKFIWLITGLVILWLINVIRIGLFLVAINKSWKMPLGIDHHTWFNITAYTGIFLMIYFFDKSQNDISKKKTNIP